MAGALLFAGGQGVLAWAEQRVPSGTAALLLATMPMFVALFSWSGGVVAGGRPRSRPGAITGPALLLGLVGVGLIVGGGAKGSPLDALGVGALLFSAMSWAAGTMRAGSERDSSPERRAATHLIAGGTVLMGASVVTGEAGSLELGSASPSSLLALAYLIVFGTIIAYRAFVWLLSRTDPAKVASHAYVNPAVAVFLGGTVGGESLTPSTLAGAAVILLSVVLLVTPWAGAPAPDRPEAPDEDEGALALVAGGSEPSARILRIRCSRAASRSAYDTTCDPRLLGYPNRPHPRTYRSTECRRRHPRRGNCR